MPGDCLSIGSWGVSPTGTFSCLGFGLGIPGRLNRQVTDLDTN
jgi:hypothetical protein